MKTRQIPIQNPARFAGASSAKRRLLVQALLSVALPILVSLNLHAQSAGFQPSSANWVDWTLATVGNPGGSALGSMLVGSTSVNVSYSGEVFTQTQTNGSGTDYYTPVSTYTNIAVPNPPVSGMITVVGGGGTVDTVTFSQPVTNPVMAFVSLGSGGINVNYSFNSAFNILSTGPGWWGYGGPMTQTGNVLSGAESDGVIQFTGTFTSISWTVSAGDSYYSGFTFGVTNEPGPRITNIVGGNAVVFEGEPWSLTALGTGVAPLACQWSLDGTELVNQPRVFGAQSNLLAFTNALVSDTGTYQFAISNAYGVATSNVTLTVLPASNYNIFNNYASSVTNLSGLLGYWRFDPVFQMNSCVNEYTGSPQGDAQIGAGGSGCPLYLDPENQALLLDGKSSYLATSLTGQIANQGSMLAWVYLTTEPSTAGRIFSVVNQSQSGNNYDIQIETDNYTRFYAGGGVAVYTQPLPLNQWHFLGATLNAGSSADLYLDGQLVATATGGHSVSGNPVSIGESQVFTGRYFQGRIDEVAIYNVALTPAEIAALYTASLVPVLSIAPLQNKVVVTWPTNLAGYVLQTNSLLNSSNWGTVAAPYSVNSTNYAVTNPAIGSQLFYRLKN